jgi:hypothetical protein
VTRPAGRVRRQGPPAGFPLELALHGRQVTPGAVQHQQGALPVGRAEEGPLQAEQGVAPGVVGEGGGRLEEPEARAADQGLEGALALPFPVVADDDRLNHGQAPPISAQSERTAWTTCSGLVPLTQSGVGQERTRQGWQLVG